MGAAIWTMIVGSLMLMPGLNIIVGAAAFGWGGALVGLAWTILCSGGTASNETARKTVKRQARRAREWWRVLGVKPDANKDEVMAAYRRKAKQAHPDVGGSAAKMAEINRARAEAEAALGAKH